MRLLLVVLFLVLAAQPVQAGSGPNNSDLFEWYYAPIFGSGVYRVDGKSAAFITLPIRAKLAELTEADWRLTLRMPVTVGLIDSDGSTLDVFDIPERIGMASILPGLDLAIPVLGWRLLPFANLGGGVEFRSGETSLIWATGMFALHRRPFGPLDLGFGLELVHSSYHTSKGTRSALTRVGGGLDVLVPTGLHAWGREIRAGGYVAYRYYTNDLDVLLANAKKLSVRQEIEIVASLAVDRPFRIFGFEVGRFGVGYRYGDGLKGVRLVTEFPF